MENEEKTEMYQENELTINEEDNFKKIFKYFKSKNPLPDLSSVIQLSDNCEVSFEY